MLTQTQIHRHTHTHTQRVAMLISDRKFQNKKKHGHREEHYIVIKWSILQ